MAAHCFAHWAFPGASAPRHWLQPLAGTGSLERARQQSHLHHMCCCTTCRAQCAATMCAWCAQRAQRAPCAASTCTLAALALQARPHMSGARPRLGAQRKKQHRQHHPAACPRLPPGCPLPPWWARGRPAPQSNTAPPTPPHTPHLLLALACRRALACGRAALGLLLLQAGRHLRLHLARAKVTLRTSRARIAI